MNAQTETEDLLPEYNFDYSKAKPNRFAHKVVNVTLDEDIAKIFTTSEAVNKALRAQYRPNQKHVWRVIFNIKNTTQSSCFIQNNHNIRRINELDNSEQN